MSKSILTPTSATVRIQPGASSPDSGNSFNPNTLTISTISRGSTVIWKNDDSTLHTVTSGTTEGESGTVFDSSYLAADKTFEWRFDNDGTFDYYCTLHPYLKGKIIVS